MQAKLIVVGGKANKSAVALRLPTVIGRSREAQLTVAHPMISRQHCEIFEVDGLLMIRDLGSLNGTLVDGRRIIEAPLCPDAEFTVGPLTFRAQYQYAGNLDALPPVKMADEATQPGATKSDEQIPDFFVGKPEAAEEIGDVKESAATGKEDEEQEPEPTPPPPVPFREAPIVKHSAARAIAEEPATEQEPTPAEESPVEQQPEGVSSPAQTIGAEKAEELPDFFSALDSNSGEDESAEADDSELDDFLKGLK